MPPVSSGLKSSSWNRRPLVTRNGLIRPRMSASYQGANGGYCRVSEVKAMAIWDDTPTARTKVDLTNAAKHAQQAEKHELDAAASAQLASEHEQDAQLALERTETHEQEAELLRRQAASNEQETHQARQEAHVLLADTQAHQQ